ncbi:DUF4129 domain-containing protein [Hymenobacter sp. DG25A]|uniref:DUF4129 domain-containing protein n=1 Tax=Hymenobacter sp. DG25A TaxID=1385663 RepID=UPI0006C850EB|nr:DUF4129 domain-containing protein [Hymenobacter sp. DG25A]
MRANTSRPAPAHPRWLPVAVLSALVLLLTAATPAIPARTKPARAAIHLPTDRTTPRRLLMPAARLREFRRQRAFQYVEPLPEEASTWDLFWRRFRQWLGELLMGPGYQSRGRYVMYAAFGAAFLYVLLRLLRLDYTSAFGRASRSLPLSYEAAPEDINSIDFAARLEEAEATGNYRLGVRLGYLLILHTLTSRHLINWQPDKTNHSYLQELAGTPWQDGFSLLTRQFEYVWYGEETLTPLRYATVRDARQQFLAALTRRAAS